jgi:hypothetical protein
MKLQSFFENLKRQRDAIFTFARCLILVSKSFLFVVQCFLEILVRYRIVVCVFDFSAQLRKSNAFAFFRCDINLTTSFLSRSNELALDFVAILDDQSVVQIFV